ncbi:MAG: DUF4116 domain-containing protein [Pseudomonadota bacterium]
MKIISRFYLLVFFLILPFHNSHADDKPKVLACDIAPDESAYLLDQVRADNKPQIRAMDDCKKSNRAFFAKIIDINPNYFEFAADDLRDDEVFISKFVTLNPEILKYASPRLISDHYFMFKMAKIYPDALKYAAPKLINNKEFIAQMIKINPKNFAYASERLQDDQDIALLALKNSGKMLRFASPRLQNNKKVVMQAIQSYSLAISFASEELQKNPQIKKLSQQINYQFISNLDNFLKQNYGGLGVGPEGSRGYHIVNMAKFFPEKQITYHPYITKWEQVYKNGVETDEIRLTTKSINDGGWKVDFADYPELIKAVEKIFINNGVDQNTIDGLNAVSLWKISDHPQIIAFDLYLLRQIDNHYLKSDTANVVALTAIARQTENKKWEINVVDAIFDADLKMSVAYENGHRRYKIWDVYLVNKKDKNPKILFKVEDKDGEYFDLFAKQLNNRYASIYKGGGYAMEINLFEK